ncbi:MAG: DUF4350 domain-containing protein [Actinomycetaceae bacterium]|nr:DUF4350 domain-containing protein [Actinomycetaceae bacterium]
MSVATAKGRSLREVSKSWGLWLILAMVAVIVLSMVFGYERQYQPSDPRSAQPDGTKGLVQVLKSQGVDVEVVLSVDEMPQIDEDTAVLIDQSPYITHEDITALPGLVRGAGRVVLYEWAYAPEAFNLDDSVDGGEREFSAKDFDKLCSDIFGYARVIATDSLAFVSDIEGADLPPRVCFSTGFGYHVGVWPKTEDNPEYIWFPNPIFKNSRIRDYDTAAAALTVLGKYDRLVWVYPSFENTAVDLSTDGVWGLLPRWTYSSAMLLILAALAFMLYRGRRFGPLASERLPVTVKSSETVIAHGHLLYQTKDAAWAIGALQSQTRRRIRKALLLPDEISQSDFITTVARRSGRSDQEIHMLLFAPYVGNESQLVQRAKELDALIEEVTHD